VVPRRVRDRCLSVECPRRFHVNGKATIQLHKRSMIARTRVGRFFRGLLLYAVAASLIGYFALQAFHGNYGLDARKGYEEDITRLTRERDELQSERKEIERRVVLLRPESIDPDMVEELARRDLGFAGPKDLLMINTRR
jgi:cell division protein FtsB